MGRIYANYTSVRFLHYSTPLLVPMPLKSELKKAYHFNVKNSTTSANPKTKTYSRTFSLYNAFWIKVVNSPVMLYKSEVKTSAKIDWLIGTNDRIVPSWLKMKLISSEYTRISRSIYSFGSILHISCKTSGKLATKTRSVFHIAFSRREIIKLYARNEQMVANR